MAVMILIIIIDLIAIGIVLYVGSQHDAHHAHSTADASVSLKAMADQDAALQRAIDARDRARKEAEEHARKEAEAQAKAKAEADAKAKAEAEAKAKAEAEAAAKANAAADAAGETAEAIADKQEETAAETSDADSPLGDEAARAERRAKALARKAARQKAQSGE